MSGVNVHISMSNLSQLDQHQNNINRLPITHHDQNAAIIQDNAQKRVTMPVEADTVEKKSVDPDNRKEEKGRSKQKRIKTMKQEVRLSMEKCNDHLIDVQA